MHYYAISHYISYPAAFPHGRRLIASLRLQFGILPYLRLHPLTQNDQIQHANNNTYGEERIFRSTTLLHLHKCVTWFVSDVWVSCEYNKCHVDAWCHAAADSVAVTAPPLTTHHSSSAANWFPRIAAAQWVRPHSRDGLISEFSFS